MGPRRRVPGTGSSAIARLSAISKDASDELEPAKAFSQRMTDAGRRPVRPRLFAQLGIAALIVFAVALTVHLWGAELSHWVREQVLRFRPVTALRTAGVVAVVTAALRLISTKTNG